jgi:hypothetical protein
VDTNPTQWDAAHAPQACSADGVTPAEFRKRHGHGTIEE